MKKLMLSLSLTILLASCQASPTPQLTATLEPTNPPALPTVTSQEFLDEAQAQIAAQKALKGSFTYIEPLTMLKLEKMSYGEYAQLIEGPLNQEADLEVWAAVFFDDQFQSVPPTAEATPLPPFRGCVYVAITTGSGVPVEIGGPLSFNRSFPECDT